MRVADHCRNAWSPTMDGATISIRSAVPQPSLTDFRKSANSSIRPTPGIVVAPACLGVGPAQDQATDPVGMRDRCGDARRPRIGVPEQCRALALGGVEHRQQIVHAILQGRDLRQSIGEAEAARVHDDQSAEARESGEEAVHPRLVPEDFEVRHGARYEQQVWAGGSDDLVGESRAVVPCIRGLWPIHGRIVSRRMGRRKGDAARLDQTSVLARYGRRCGVRLDPRSPPRFLYAEADGNRTRLGALAPTPVLKTGGPTRRPDASAREDSAEPLPAERLVFACP